MSIKVHYIEGRTRSSGNGPFVALAPADAAEAASTDNVYQRLSDLMAGLGHLPGFLGADLLTSPAQPGLCLLESRWAGAVPALDIPAGCKAWAFDVAESWSPPPQA